MQTDMPRLTIAFALLCACAAQDVQKDLERIAAASGGRVGVSAVLIESGEHAALHGDRPFFMASVVKFPVALRVLHLVDEDKLRLDQKVQVRASDRAPGVTTLDGRFKPGALFTVRELLEFMTLNSDNTACDVLLRLYGGPPAVQSRLESMGIHGIRVDRTEKELAAAYSESRAQFLKDARDTSTPDAMAALLAKFEHGEALKPATTAFLRDLMERAATAPNRLKGLLPPGNVVAHKTGTWREAATNDAGIITLPGGAGHIAIAVFTNQAKSGVDLERTIAEIARAVYDHWTRPNAH
jgi:beta-lactamase class A